MVRDPIIRKLIIVPILGMILGNAISAIGVGLNTVQKEFTENRDKVETYLAMGASRFEAVKPVGVEALKLALLPTVNQMR
jgi:ABC-type iron transport system FetAB permease component